MGAGGSRMEDDDDFPFRRGPRCRPWEEVVNIEIPNPISFEADSPPRVSRPPIIERVVRLRSTFWNYDENGRIPSRWTDWGDCYSSDEEEQSASRTRSGRRRRKEAVTAATAGSSGSNSNENGQQQRAQTLPSWSPFLDGQFAVDGEPVRGSGWRSNRSSNSSRVSDSSTTSTESGVDVVRTLDNLEETRRVFGIVASSPDRKMEPANRR